MRPTIAAAGGVLLLALLPGAAGAQTPASQSLVAGAHYQTIRFDETLGAEEASLLLLPVAYRLPLGKRLTADLYGAWARGRVRKEDRTFTLDGLVDTRLRLALRASSGVVLTAGLNLPTGNEDHTTAESFVASILATDLLGFRESNLGVGFSLSSGIAAAHRVGEWAVGGGVSYRLASDFEPRADTSFRYKPGNEIRVRAAVDRTVGGGKVTLGATFQEFTVDEVDGKNLFQSGNRWRADAAYAFRTGPQIGRAHV